MAVTAILMDPDYFRVTINDMVLQFLVLLGFVTNAYSATPSLNLPCSAPNGTPETPLIQPGHPRLSLTTTNLAKLTSIYTGNDPGLIHTL